MKRLVTATFCLALVVTSYATVNESALDIQIPQYQPKAEDGAKQPVAKPRAKLPVAHEQQQASIPLTAPSNGGSSVSISGQHCKGGNGSASCGQLELEKSLHKPSVSVGVEGGF